MLATTRSRSLLFAAALLFFVIDILFAQSTIQCKTGPGLTMTGCTAFGFGDVEEVRQWGLSYISAYQHDNTDFFNAVFDHAQTWLAGHMDGVYDYAELYGEPKVAISTYNGGWIDGWIGVER